MLTSKDAKDKPLVEFNEHTPRKGYSLVNRIVISPKQSPYEMAAQFVKQMQVQRQIQKGAEMANGDAYAYQTEMRYLRSADQMIQEKRLCEAAAEAAMAEFMHDTKQLMTSSDKLKSINNPALKAYEKGLKDYNGNRTAALSKAIEADVNQNKDPLHTEYFDRMTQEIGKAVKEGRSSTIDVERLGKDGLIDQMFKKKVPNEQMAAVACSGLLNEKQQTYTLNRTMKSPEFCAFSMKRIDDMRLVEERRSTLKKQHSPAGIIRMAQKSGQNTGK